MGSENARHSSECPMHTSTHARHSSEGLTTGNMEFPCRAITSHDIVPFLAHTLHMASIACITKRETMGVKDSHYFVYQLDSNT
jgi:hypothetical protein